MPAPAALPLQGTDTVTDHVTCLGCGCACDDIRVVVRDGQIQATERACELGTQWFDQARARARVLVDGQDAELPSAITAAATLLAKTAHPLVYLADDLSCEAQRAACEIADILRGQLESATSSTAAPGILAAQARGRATATLGEIRHRADLVVFWGVDPVVRYPRFVERYLSRPEPRTIIAIDIGSDTGPTHANARFAIAAQHEITMQSLIAGTIKGRTSQGSASSPSVPKALIEYLTSAHYIALITDGEPRAGRDAERAEGLLVLAEALNAYTRCALITLRAGGNRVGAEAVMTWQTGYPMSVDFSRGFPRYRRGTGSLTTPLTTPLPGDAGGLKAAPTGQRAVLIVGAWTSLPETARQLGRDTPCVIIGPQASARVPTPFVAIDTGVAGVHEGGMAYRLDEIPLPLTPVLAGVPNTADILGRVARTVQATFGPGGLHAAPTTRAGLSKS